ncbi:SprT-like domain-containing protein [Nesterenkonia marinintestina]|uniref:SprT-like domain-containing protein n=1 Tax=Nesterenkonia marinintestina TaxID=2979865 RepID=UPI0021BE5553|nr:SprT-like domain-containing protein [Nesterenkonia sp. GX14115]
METTYREAAALLWGEAGDYVHDAYQRHRHLFPGIPESVPMVIGLTAYGRCIGLTRLDAELLRTPRISIASTLFERGRRAVDDVVVHEMMHLHLAHTGKRTDHRSADWYAEVRRLAPEVLGRELDVRHGGDRRSVRVPNPAYEPGNGEPKTLVRKERVEAAVQHGDVAHFPQAFRPEGHDQGAPIEVYTY